jgi:two-component system sensor histidine kinase DesK
MMAGRDVKADQDSLDRQHACAGLEGRRAPRRLFGLDWFNLSWLLYLLFWFINPLAIPSSKSWIEFGLALSAFLILYFIAHGPHTLRSRVLATIGMSVIALLYVPVNLSAFGIYIFIAATIPELTRTAKQTYWILAGMCAIIGAQAAIYHLPSWEWSIAIGISSLTAVNIQHFMLRRKADAKLRMAHQEIEQLAKTAERERIARDLHDVLGHTLSLISIKSELAARLLATDPARSQRELEEIQITSRRALAEVRQTVAGYRAQGLEAELQQVTSALAAAGVTLVSSPVEIPRMPAEYEAALALIVREAVTNIVRHAGARSCAVSIHADSGMIYLEIRDDGRGVRGREGNGLTGMRERLRELGGKLTIHAAEGTLLQINLPLPEGASVPVEEAIANLLPEPARS